MSKLDYNFQMLLVIFGTILLMVTAGSIAALVMFLTLIT